MPSLQPVTDTSPDTMSANWIRWFLAVYSVVTQQPQQIGSAVSLANQNASINATSMPIPALANGNYRVSYYLEKTLADGVNSSTQVTIGWQRGAKALSHQFPALTQDNNLAVDAQTWPVVIDQNTAITYAVAYASNTPGKMQYLLTVWVEQA